MNKRNIDKNVKPTLFSRLNTSDKMYTAKDISILLDSIHSNYEGEISKLLSQLTDLKTRCSKNPSVEYPTLSVLDIVYKDNSPYLKIQFNPGSYEFDETTGVNLSSIKINNGDNLLSTISENNLLPISNNNISAISYEYSDGNIPHNNIKDEVVECKISASSDVININTIWINTFLDDTTNAANTCIANFEYVDETIIDKLKLTILNSNILIYNPKIIGVKQFCVLVPNHLNIKNVEIFDFKDGYAYNVMSKPLKNSILYYLNQAAATTHNNIYKIEFKY